MTRVAFLVNGAHGSAMGHRARAFAQRLPKTFDVRIAFRSRQKILSVLRFFGFLAHTRPGVTYVFDMAYSGVVAGAAYRTVSGNRLIIDTGDAIAELARSMGRGPVRLWLTRLLERLSLATADRIVVRGSAHRDWLNDRGVCAELIPDGVELGLFAPRPAGDLRQRLGLEGFLTVGVVGSSLWSPALNWCYGWELVEAVGLLRDARVKGVMIGDGSGIEQLQRRCAELDITDRVAFLGRVPYEQLPRYLAIIDVCLSTQTNDLPGQVRTTGKLPLYLAAGRYILATRVGEAARVLGQEMLLGYEGVHDRDYPSRLADRIRGLLMNPERLARGADGVAIARRHFDYDVLASRLADLLVEVSESSTE